MLFTFNIPTSVTTDLQSTILLFEHFEAASGANRESNFSFYLDKLPT